MAVVVPTTPTSMRCAGPGPLCLTLLGFLHVLQWGCAGASPTLNVLHLVADDLRPELGLYNSPNAITPNLDKLAATSSVFVNAYCQQPVCSPSRNSFMTGLRPDSTGAWNFINYFRERRPSAVSLPEFFKRQAGYLALGSGKLYHTSNPPNHDEPLSWSPEADGTQTYFEPDWQHCDGPASTFCVNDTKPEEEDVQTAAHCVAHLERATEEGKGFYVGCGFHRPHAPYLVPAWAYAKFANRTVTAAVHRVMDSSVPDIACIHNFGIGVENGTRYAWDPRGLAVPVSVELQVRRHYFAAVTYMDSLVGRVLDALAALAVADRTVVVFHADHGYFQGESGEWEKKMLFENTARVPLIIHDPANPHHRRVTALVELVDVYPTLAVLAGFAEPPDLDGVSLAPLVRGSRAASRPGALKPGAFTQYPRCHADLGSVSSETCLEVPERNFSYMGYSVRTEDWRYVEWRRWIRTALQADWDAAPVAVELYNHTGHHADSPLTFDREQINVANASALQPTARTLHSLLRQQFAPTQARTAASALN